MKAREISMQLSANKGEWSEFYAFLKILSDKVLYSADEALALIPNAFIKVLSVIRQEGSNELIYEIDEDQDKIVIKVNSKVLALIPIFQITGKLAGILKRIKEGADSKGSFKIDDVQEIMKELHCKKIKSSSSKKADISLKIEDPNTGTKPIREFSIKSKIGGMSTLFNASGATNFEFEILSEGGQNKDKAKIGLNRILTENEDLKFVQTQDVTFRQNLIMIDSRMPEIIAEMIKAYYLGIQTTVQGLALHIEKINPLNMEEHQHFYEYKVQEVLLAVAFGMQPSKPWNGSYETHGGYIVVKENGDLACYHVYDRDKFRKFLFMNTKFETPSTTRHKFGQIYEREGKKYIKLSLQIRFKN
jgi:type II restriction enzyme